MRLALIDHDDSFVYNLYQYLAELLGRPPEVIAHTTRTRVDDSSFDAFVIGPGPGHPVCPADIGVSATIIAQTRRPLLGVCLGHQAIVTGMGGIVGRAPEPMHGRTSLITHDNGALFAGLPPAMQVTRYHSLCAYEPLPACLQVSAHTADGVVMAIAHRTRPMWGVQFHPESVATPEGQALLGNFLRLCASAPRPPRVQVQPWASAPDRQTAAAPRVWRVLHQALPLEYTPERVFEAFFAHQPGAFWLDSSSAASGRGRFDWMGDATGPRAYRLRYRLGEGLQRADAQHPDWQPCPEPDPLAHMAQAVGGTVRGAHDLPLPFLGGFVGYLGYELKAFMHPLASQHASPWPDACLTWVDRFIAIDHVAQRLYLVSVQPDGTDLADAQAWMASMQTRLRALAAASAALEPPCVPASSDAVVEFVPELDRAAYGARMAQAQAAIAAGESYELCLTQRLRTAVAVDPWALYRCVRRLNPAPYAAFLAYEGFHVLSASPEQFLKVSATGAVLSAPIKGTRPRSADAAIDQAYADDLAKHPKDRAENLMIVDLVRHDLGQVCVTGSVAVPTLMQVQSFATVHQLVSRVTGQLRPGATAIDALRACFPGGSMTGAPKLRTMTLIDQLEASARGVYSGCLGYQSLDGAAEWGMVIRTLVCEPTHCELGTGGAIVSLSDPQTEWTEILVKARAMMQATAWCLTGDPQAYRVAEDTVHRAAKEDSDD